MGKCNDIDNVLKRNGTNQQERFVTQLDPSLFELNDFDVADWILFAYNFAKHINYFDTANSDTTVGNWQDFFRDFGLEDSTIPSRESNEIRAYQRQKENITKVINTYKENGNLTPHLTLFVTFLQLLEHSKNRFNALTKRHLDFYYKNILQVDKRAATPDNVHVIFELAKKSVQEQIVVNTALNAKQDDNGTQLIYNTNNPLIANQATVASLKTIYNDVSLQELKASPVANTLDGLEEPLPENEPYWLPFGYNSQEKNFTELPDASIGFAIGSPLLNLKEGTRTVEITINFTTETVETAYKLTDFDPSDIASIIAIYGSGKEKWVGPLALKIASDAVTGMSTKIVNNNQLVLSFQLNKDADAITNYNPAFLFEKYDTQFPVVQFLINTAKEDVTSVGHNFYRAIVNRRLAAIKVKVNVQEATAVHLENDNGRLNSKKPFFPFTPQPIKGANFYVNYEEAFSKSWTSVDVNFSWKNTPIGFADWYKAYLKPSTSREKAGTYTNAIKETTIATDKQIVTADAYFTVANEILNAEQWDALEKTKVLFTPIPDDDDENITIGYRCNVKITNGGNKYKFDKAGPIRLSLNQSFLQELFPRIYALALTSDAVANATIPNEPYIPLAENITINYIAEETRTIQSQTLPIDDITPIVTVNNSVSYKNERIKLFHIHPFGQCEEHNYLKVQKHLKGITDVYDTPNIHSYIIPKYCNGGELFIGLENAQVQQNVALLIQVLEGSENPQTAPFGATEKVQWAVLCDDKWKNITNDIISNNTDNFLNSGIIKFSIPRQATQNNTRLPEGYIWVRAKMHKAYNAVCKAINIHTQAVRATFKDGENELSHLNNGLPAGTIKKLITRIPQVKGVTQPYNSFNGIPEESDQRFYRRISERLRHKNRAITLWDYEHIILQEFPDVFKVKCLNHTYIEDENNAIKDNYVAPGHVTLVVIPDSVNKNVFDIYQPRVSKALINKITTFINTKNTLHINANVINPRYEEVSVTLEVAFLESFDERFYSKQLEEDITKFLSPWAFSVEQEIRFGIDLHKSILIDYIEKLPYVDYLQNVVIEKDKVIMGNVITPSNPRSILVSAKSHNISTVLTTCTGEKIQEKIICQ